MDALRTDVRSARASAVVGALIALAIVACAVVVLGSDASAARLGVAPSRPTIMIVSSPNVQTVETRVVSRADAKTHAERPVVVIGTARFTITVTNPNRVGLVGVKVADRLAPDCNRSIGTLAARASVTFSCLAAKVPRNYTNIVTVSGLRSTGVRGLAKAQATATATTASAVKVRAKVTAQSRQPFFTG